MVISTIGRDPNRRERPLLQNARIFLPKCHAFLLDVVTFLLGVVSFMLGVVSSMLGVVTFMLIVVTLMLVVVTLMLVVVTFLLVVVSPVIGILMVWINISSFRPKYLRDGANPASEHSSDEDYCAVGRSTMACNEFLSTSGHN